MTSVDGHYLFASSIAALVARVITHPMDTIKTRLQVLNTRGNDIAVLRKVVLGQGVASLYHGLPVTLLFSVPALSVYLSCYETTKQGLYQKYHIERTSVVNHMLSGCAAEVAAGTLFTPMEVMKNRLQTRHDLQYSALKLAKTIMRTEGFRGFYRGYWMGLAVFVPHTMTYFVCYEKLKEWVTPHALPFQTYMFSSSIAGVISILVSTPLDIVKTRWQISADEHGKAYRKGPLVIGKELILKEGKGALTRGLWARIAWGIPTTAISMTVFELLKDGNA